MERGERRMESGECREEWIVFAGYFQWESFFGRKYVIQEFSHECRNFFRFIMTMQKVKPLRQKGTKGH